MRRRDGDARPEPGAPGAARPPRPPATPAPQQDSRGRRRRARAPGARPPRGRSSDPCGAATGTTSSPPWFARGCSRGPPRPSSPRSGAGPVRPPAAGRSLNRLGRPPKGHRAMGGPEGRQPATPGPPRDRWTGAASRRRRQRRGHALSRERGRLIPAPREHHGAAGEASVPTKSRVVPPSDGPADGAGGVLGAASRWGVVGRPPVASSGPGPGGIPPSGAAPGRLAAAPAPKDSGGGPVSARVCGLVSDRRAGGRGCGGRSCCPCAGQLPVGAPGLSPARCAAAGFAVARVAAPRPTRR